MHLTCVSRSIVAINTPIAAAYAFLPGALASHISKHYVEYLEFYPPNQPSTNSSNVSTLYYVRDFERVEDNTQVSSYA